MNERIILRPMNEREVTCGFFVSKMCSQFEQSHTAMKIYTHIHFLRGILFSLLLVGLRIPGDS